jgi:hypothetical protein
MIVAENSNMFYIIGKKMISSGNFYEDIRNSITQLIKAMFSIKKYCKIEILYQLKIMKNGVFEPIMCLINEINDLSLEFLMNQEIIHSTLIYAPTIAQHYIYIVLSYIKKIVDLTIFVPSNTNDFAPM